MAAMSMLERIRTAIAVELARLGVRDTSCLRETILIRDGLYCGRKFQCEKFSVVWFIEENEIKFFGPTGNLLVATTSERIVELVEEQRRPAA